MSTRVLYVVYSVQTARGTGLGRNTIFIDGLPEGEDRLDMTLIRKIEDDELVIARETEPTALALFLVDWKWIRADGATPPAPPAA